MISTNPANSAARLVASAASALMVIMTLGCATDTPEASIEPTSNSNLNLTFAALPSGFEVTQNDASGLRLATTDPDDPGEMWVDVGERSDFGIQITDIVTAQKALFEAMPGGSFNGNNELMTQNGRAFYSRGRYTHDGAPVEETRTFQIHPGENRLVTLHYRYPAGEDSGARVQQLLVLLGEMSVPTTTAGEGEESPSE